MINGISQGISDSNPISSAFVISVVLMGMLGLKDPGVGLMCASILLISCGTGCRYATGPFDRLAAGNEPSDSISISGDWDS